MKASRFILLFGILYLLTSCKFNNAEVSKEDVAHVESIILSSLENPSRYDTLAEAVGHQDTIIDQTIIEQD